MAMHRITLTQIGGSIGSTLDLYCWDGAAWVLLVASIPKASLASGYLFEDTTGATRFKVVDTGGCGTELVLECESSTTTIAPTTTLAPTTTTEPTTTIEPATTSEPTTTIFAPTTKDIPPFIPDTQYLIRGFNTLEGGEGDPYICSEEPFIVYSAPEESWGTGTTIWNSLGENVPFDLVVLDGDDVIYFHNTVTGIIGSDTTERCTI